MTEKKDIYPGRKNLIPLNKRTIEEQRKIARMGGSANKNNSNLSRGMKLSWIKKSIKAGKLKPEDPKYLLSLVENKEMMDIDMLNWLNHLRAEAKDPEIQAKLLSIYNQIAKTIHGDKKIIEGRHLHMHLGEDMSGEEIAELLDVTN